MHIRPITDKLMTRKDLAAFLRVTTRTVDNLRAEGLPTIMVGASPRFDIEQVKSWLKEKKVEVARETASL